MQMQFVWQCLAWNHDGRDWWVDFQEDESNRIEQAWRTSVPVLALTEKYQIHSMRDRIFTAASSYSSIF